MKKPVIIIADSDKFYVEALIWKFVETWGNKIELNVITEQEYFQDFFSTLQEADTVLVSAEMYTQELHRHEISKIIVLREDTDLPHPQPGILWMNKYANIKSIINEAMEECSVRNSQSENGNKDTRVIAVSSAIGGSGKTTISLGLALGLARQHKHVLYISTELSQSFRFFLKNKRTIGTGIFQSLQETREESTAFLEPYIRQEEFDYIPPLYTTLEAYNLSFSVYEKVLQSIRKMQNYDYVILDMENGCDNKNASLMVESDYVITVVQQDGISVEKTNFLMKNMDYSNHEKYLFVCNKYDVEKPNYLFQDENEKYSISAYIENGDVSTLPSIGESSGIRNLVYMFL